jgi:ABC-type long-subunit fatty acid transport system fused permease/ATPase subunit
MSAPEPPEKITGMDISTEILSADRKGAIFVSLPKWAAWAIIAWQIRLSIETLTGNDALPSLLARFWRQTSIWEVVCWGTCLLGVTVGLHSRYLFKKQVRRELARVEVIEKKLDAFADGAGNISASHEEKEV